MKTFFNVLFGVVFSSLTAQQYGNEFLHIGVDAAALAQGGQVTARIDNVNAAYWNPAGLLHVNRAELSLMHAAYFKNQAQLDYAAYAKKIDENASASVSLMRFGVDNIMNTTRLIDENGNVDYNRITYFSVADYALTLSYARKNVYKNLNAGVNIKLIYRHIGDFAEAFGFGFDIGLQYRLKSWQFGFVIKDATTTHTFWSFNEERLQEIRDAVQGLNQTRPDKHEMNLPMVQTGIMRKFRIRKDYGLAVELGAQAYFYEREALIRSAGWSLEPGLGVQGDFKEKIFLRTGINNIYRTEIFGEKLWRFNPTAGVGIRFHYLHLDYAFTGFIETGLQAHVFSVILDLRIFRKN